MNPMSRLDPELVGPLQGLLDATDGGFSLRDIPATRAQLKAMVAAVTAELPPVDGIESSDRVVPLSESRIDVPVRLHRPIGIDEPLPVLIWMHPGGYVIGSVEMDDRACAELARDVGCVVVSVEYRLAPENPYPAALDDCVGVLQWLGRNGADWSLDSSRIAVGGASAGGGLAAATALRTRDEALIQPCFQLLVYPALDDSNVEPASATLEDNLFWSRENALIGWRSYLEGRQGTADVPVYAAASRAADLSQLPPAFIGVGSADMFMHENIHYAERLVAAGVPVELAVYPGAFHAFDAFAPMARVSQRFVNERNRALRAALF